MIKDNCFHISKLILNGVGLHSEIVFKSGLNIITGPTDSGKSFILECINFMLGSDEEIRNIPEVKYYTDIFLEIELANQSKITFKRNVLGGDYTIYQTSYLNIKDTISFEIKSRPSFKKFLNKIVGAEDVKLRYNAANVTHRFSFRQFSDYLFLEEDRVISKKSGLISEQFTEKTIYRSMFNFLLTGDDDSHLVKDKVQKANEITDEAKRDTLIRLGDRLKRSIEKEKRSIGENISLENIDSDLRTLQNKKNNLDKDYSIKLSKLFELEKFRNTLSNEFNEIQSNSSRFEILNNHYSSDLKRLQFIYESIQLADQLPNHDCPYCGIKMAIVSDETHNCSFDDYSLVESIKNEIGKIQKNLIELKLTIKSLDARFSLLEKEIERTDQKIFHLRSIVNVELKPLMTELQKDIDKLRLLSEKKWRVGTLENELSHINSLFEHFDISPFKKVVDDIYKVPADEINYLCMVILNTLLSWKFITPDSSVEFFIEMPDIFDIIINQKKRSHFGKGSRAIFIFALYYSLMKICIEKNMIHPGFIIVDSPLNPYKGSESVDDDGKISDLQTKNIFQGLVNNDSSLQVILIENKIPPEDVIEKCNYIEFSEFGPRFGFLN